MTTPQLIGVQSDTKLGYGVGIVIGLCTLVGTVMFVLCLFRILRFDYPRDRAEEVRTTTLAIFIAGVSWHLRASSSTWPPTSLPSSRTAPSAALVFKEQFGRARRSTLLGASVRCSINGRYSGASPPVPGTGVGPGIGFGEGLGCGAIGIPHAGARPCSTSERDRSLQVHDHNWDAVSTLPNSSSSDEARSKTICVPSGATLSRPANSPSKLFARRRAPFTYAVDTLVLKRGIADIKQLVGRGGCWSPGKKVHEMLRSSDSSTPRYRRRSQGAEGRTPSCQRLCGSNLRVR